jgi:3-phosphoshikimate 1-carboxyvinyltransferase
MKLLLRKCISPKGEIKMGGDKSITHRGLIIGAIAQGKTVVHGYSRCADCMATLEIFKQLGISIKDSGSTISIEGKGLDGFVEPDDVLDCKNSGTTMRLLAGVLSGQNFFSVLTGDSSLRKRPMQRIIRPLDQMGAEIRSRCGGFAPLGIKGGKLKSIDYKLPVASAQVKSAILLAGLYADEETIVEEPKLTRDHTERMFSLFGAKVEKEDKRIILKKKNKLNAQELIIPGDISSAAYFIALACLAPGSELYLKDIGVNPTRTGILDVLKMMGADISVVNTRTVSNEPIAGLMIKYSKLKTREISGQLIPRLIDEMPILAVAATQVQGITVIKDAAELRVKETDRISAIVVGLKDMGAKIEEKKDGFVVEGPTRLYGAQCNSFGDHRIAMALTIAGFIADGQTIIDGAECISISFPEFITLAKTVCGEANVTIQD